MKNNFLIIFFISIFFASCDDYLDVNDTPNSALIAAVPPNLKLAAAQSQMYRVISGDNRGTSADIRNSSMNQLGNIFMNSWAGNSNSVGSAYLDEYTVNMGTSFYNEIWDYSYINLTNLNSIVTYDSQDFDNHKAIAMILESFYMQYIVDLYGDCPYSEAFKGSAVLYPKYDDARTVYRALYDRLDQAETLIVGANSSDAVVGGEDVMLGGNMADWIKFSNTIKLRLLIRQSGLTDTDTTTYIDGKLNDLMGKSYITTDITLNPGYNNVSTNSQNPFYGAYGYNNSATPGATFNRDYVMASKHAADALNGTITSVADPRAGRLFVLVAGQVVGIQQGEPGMTAPDNPSRLGPALIPTDNTIGSLMDSYVMTLSESKFLLAEAALKYPSKFPGLFPQTLFNEGVTASFVRLGAPIGTYLTDIDGVDGYGWTGSSNKISAIMTQKWLALMSVHAIESFIDKVRTGFPSTPLPVINTTGIPKRLMYSVSEYSSNAANVPNQTPATVFSTGSFWAQ